MQGRKLVLWTDSESADKRFKQSEVDSKCLYDVRIARLLSWLWANFTLEQLDVKFILGEFNQMADLLSRWNHKETTDHVGGEFCQIKEDVKMVQTIAEDEAWRVLHDGHVEIQTMRYRSQVWGNPVQMSMFKERWLRCGICQRHRDVRKMDGMSSLNKFSKPGEAFGLDYIGLIEGKDLLVKIDYLSKLVELDVCDQADSKHTVSVIEKWESHRGLIGYLVADGAKHFKNVDVKRWVEAGGVTHIKTLAYDHQVNGIVERCIRSVLQLLRRQQSAHLQIVVICQ